MSAPLSQELRDLLALSLVPGLGPRLTRALLERFGSASAVRQATAEQMQQVPHIGADLAGKFTRSLASSDIEPELALLQRHGVDLLPMSSPAYPARLATIPDAPQVLLFRRTLLPVDDQALAPVTASAAPLPGQFPECQRGRAAAGGRPGHAGRRLPARQGGERQTDRLPHCGSAGSRCHGGERLARRPPPACARRTGCPGDAG